jgi:hypothetical protein
MIAPAPHAHVWGPCMKTKLSQTYRQSCTVAGCDASQACTP